MSDKAQYIALAEEAANRHGFPPEVFKALINQESGFNPKAKSPVGAIGIAQIMPSTAQGWGVDPTDPVASLDVAARNLAGYFKTYGGDLSKTLAAYNAGPGAVSKYGGVPPYTETQNYVKSILTQAGLKKNSNPLTISPGSPPTSSPVIPSEPVAHETVGGMNTSYQLDNQNQDIKPNVPPPMPLPRRTSYSTVAPADYSKLFQPVIPHGSGPKQVPSNFAGDLLNSFVNQSTFNLTNLPTGQGIGQTVGNTAGFIPNALVGLGLAAATPFAPEVTVPAGLFLGGALGSGSANARQQINQHGSITNPASLATDTLFGGAANLIPGSKAEGLGARLASNALRFGGTNVAGSVASQLASTGKVDLKTLTDAGLQGAAIGGVASFLHRGGVVKPKDEIPAAIQKLLPGGKEPLRLTGGKEPLRLPGDVSTITAGEHPGVVTTPYEHQTPLLPGEHGQTPLLTGSNDVTPMSHQLTTGGDVLTQPTTRPVEVSGGGVLDQSTQAKFLNGLGETTTVGQPERLYAPSEPLPVEKATEQAKVSSKVTPEGFVEPSTVVNPVDKTGNPVEQVFNNKTAANRAITNLGLDKTGVQPVNVGPKQWRLHDLTKENPTVPEKTASVPVDNSAVPTQSGVPPRATETPVGQVEPQLTPQPGEPSLVSKSMGGNDRKPVNASSLPRGMRKATAEEAISRGYNPEIVRTFSDAIEANKTLDQATGKVVTNKYRGERTSNFEDAHITPIEFVANKDGDIGVMGVNDKGHFVAAHYFDSHSKGKGIQPDSKPFINPDQVAQFDYSTTNADRAPKVHTDSMQNLQSKIKRIKDLVPKDHNAAKELDRIGNILEKEGPKSYDQLEHAFNRLEKNGHLETVLKTIEPTVGSC